MSSWRRVSWSDNTSSLLFEVMLSLFSQMFSILYISCVVIVSKLNSLLITQKQESFRAELQEVEENTLVKQNKTTRYRLIAQPIMHPSVNQVMSVVCGHLLSVSAYFELPLPPSGWHLDGQTGPLWTPQPGNPSSASLYILPLGSSMPLRCLVFLGASYVRNILPQTPLNTWQNSCT